MSPQGRQDPSTSHETAASTLALILPSCKFALTWESPSSWPSCGLTWSLHFLDILLSTAKTPTSPPFPSPSLVLSQVLSSLLHQVLRKRAGHGLPFLELLCRGSGMSPVEGLNCRGHEHCRGARIPKGPCEPILPVSIHNHFPGERRNKTSHRHSWSHGASVWTGGSAEHQQENLVQTICLECSFKTGLSTI
ncbi:hypothetical protein CIB84_009997 [Bambusicola thoracicus]|uniref:Uncharacterized protein n=1 Tax=Bambusicola thoracicus TaxID=9083 RepID=A0A2P4SQ67_BAMTH|nr:hypothetical protein CIB84_009997 [Bambusicola thoracicus]